MRTFHNRGGVSVIARTQALLGVSTALIDTIFVRRSWGLEKLPPNNKHDSTHKDETGKHNGNYSTNIDFVFNNVSTTFVNVRHCNRLLVSVSVFSHFVLSIRQFFILSIGRGSVYQLRGVQRTLLVRDGNFHLVATVREI